MSLAEDPRSYWIASVEPTRYEPLDGDTTSDVAIIGGGLVGVTAAYLLKQQGKTVTLIEGRRLLSGVTGHTTAKLTTQHGLRYSEIAAKHDRDHARLYALANQQAMDYVLHLVEDLGIDCDLLRVPAYTYSERAEDLPRIREEADLASSLGLPASFVEEVPLPFPVAGAVRFDDQAMFHPLKYLWALARAIPGGGSRIVEGTRALEVDEGRISAVLTPYGKVRARDVIVASHYPFMDRGLYFARMEQHRAYVLLARCPEVPTEGHYISTRPDYHTMRAVPTPDGLRLLVGGEEHVTGRTDDTRQRYRDLEAWARERFGITDVEYRWSTQDPHTADALPFVGRYTPVSPHLYVATGFHGWGITNGTAAAMLVSNMILESETAWEPATDPARFDQLRAVGDMMRVGLESLQHLVGDRLTRAAQRVEPTDLAPGEGRVGEVTGGRAAISRDEGGALHAVDYACSHQGCVLTWNAAEQSWDCPCHGSRFGPDGEVLHGPAVEPLKPRPVIGQERT